MQIRFSNPKRSHLTDATATAAFINGKIAVARYYLDFNSKLKCHTAAMKGMEEVAGMRLAYLSEFVQWPMFGADFSQIPVLFVLLFLLSAGKWKVTSIQSGKVTKIVRGSLSIVFILMESHTDVRAQI